MIDQFVRHYGVVALFVIIYFESLGVPLPGESALVGASILAVRGDMSIVTALLAAWTAAVLGDSTGYAIGRLAGRRLLQRYGWIVKLTPTRLAELEALFQRRGASIVVVARFVVVLRQLNGVVAGSVGMAWRQFIIANAIGGALWSACWTLGPYLLGSLWPEHLSSPAVR